MMATHSAFINAYYTTLLWGDNKLGVCIKANDTMYTTSIGPTDSIIEQPMLTDLLLGCPNIARPSLSKGMTEPGSAGQP